VTAEAAAPAPGDSTLARIPGVFFSPMRTFEAIARRPTWIAPVILWVLCSLGFSAVLLPRIDVEKMMRERFERSGRAVSEEQLRSIVERQRRFAPVFGYFGAAAGPVAVSLLVAAVLWGSFRAFGWDTTYPQALGATTHAFLPGVLGSLLLLPLVARQERVDPSALRDLLRTNPGFLVERNSKALHSLLGSLDLFSIWTLALLTIGFASAAKVRRGQAAGIILGLWGVYVLGKAGFAAIF
jgi:Yip1 domain